MNTKFLFATLAAVLLSAKAGSQTIPTFKVKVYTPASQGYYFLTPTKFGGPAASYPPTHLILDDKGNIVYYKQFSGNLTAADFKLLPNGLMSYAGSGQFMLMDSTFTVVDSVSCVDTINTDPHDMKLLPNGHYLLLGSDLVKMDLSGYNYFSHNGSPGSSNATVRCGVVQELDANKNLLFQWNSKDHYQFSDVDTVFLNGPNVVDWTHFNAVEMDDDGNILVSSRHFNEITKIDRTTGNIIWRLGGKQNYFNFINDSAMFRGQHDIRSLGNGNYTLFDDGNPKPPFKPARGKEYHLNTTNMQADLVWSFMENANTASQATGGLQRLPNGNTLIDWGVLNNYNLVFNVVDNSGNKVFEIAFDDTLYSYRSYNFATLPWSFKRPTLSCGTDSDGYYLEPTADYDSYLWSSGETSKRIYISKPDTLALFVPYGQGGFIASEPFKVYSINEPCGPSGIQEETDVALSIAPNPAKAEVAVSFTAATHESLLSLVDVTGKLVQAVSITTGQSNAVLHIDEFADGIYLLHYNGKVVKLIKE